MNAHPNALDLLPLQTAREELTQLNRTVSHCLCLATEKDLLDGPIAQHSRKIPTKWAIRRDFFFWDSWDWVVRGEDDLRRFFEIARRIGGQLHQLIGTDAAGLLPGTFEEIIGTRSKLFFPDYWLFVVHHLGWTEQLPYDCEVTWKHGSSFGDEPYSMTSRLPVNIVQASLDALTVLIDAVSQQMVNDSSIAADDSDFKNSEPELETTTASDVSVEHQPDPATRLRKRFDRPHVKKRADRLTNMEALKKELIEHIKSARDHAQAAVDFGGAPELLPRPSRRELASRVGITESAASRCFNDPAAAELNLLWDTADDLNAVMKFVRYGSACT